MICQRREMTGSTGSGDCRVPRRSERNRPGTGSAVFSVDRMFGSEVLRKSAPNSRAEAFRKVTVTLYHDALVGSNSSVTLPCTYSTPRSFFSLILIFSHANESAAILWSRQAIRIALHTRFWIRWKKIKSANGHDGRPRDEYSTGMKPKEVQYHT